jgi:hypothetical protein
MLLRHRHAVPRPGPTALLLALAWVASAVAVSVASGLAAAGTGTAGPSRSGAPETSVHPSRLINDNQGSRPTLAVEDTLRTNAAEPLPEVLVTAPRQTLDEILRRVAEGEARRDSLIRDQAYTLYVRMVGRNAKEDGPEKSEAYAEAAMRIYQKRPGRQRTVMLKEWSRYDEKSDEKEASVRIRAKKGYSEEESDADRSGGSGKSGITVNVDGDMSEQFVAFAFDPKTRSRFRFQIEDRNVIGDQVVYILSFTPKSPLDLLPSGRAWVNTNDFVILREEFSYGDRSPAPLFLESLDSCVLERTRVDGRYWVLSRVLARVTLTGPIRWMGRVAGKKVPKVADFAMRWDDWIVNGDIPDSLFAPAGGVAK